MISEITCFFIHLAGFRNRLIVIVKVKYFFRSLIDFIPDFVVVYCALSANLLFNHFVYTLKPNLMTYNDETLKDALLRVGDEEHITHLTTQAQYMTKTQVTHFLNNEVDENLNLGTIKSLRKLAKQRVIEGKSVFPWDKMEDVQHNEADDHIGGGVW